MEQSDPDLWSFCIAWSLSVTVSFVITAAPSSTISDSSRAFSQQKELHGESERAEKKNSQNATKSWINIFLVLLFYYGSHGEPNAQSNMTKLLRLE